MPGVEVTAGGEAIRFGPQGEGAIEGTYLQYEVPSLAEHGAFAFSRFEGAS